MAFKLLGVEELDAALAEFSERTVKRIVNLGLKKSAENSLIYAKEFAPYKTGQTREALKVERIKRNRKYFGFKVQAGIGDYKGDEFYAPFTELGHHLGKRTPIEAYFIGRKKLSKGWRRTWLEGKHWLKEAFAVSAKESREIALATIRAGIDREVKRMAKKAAKTG